MRTKRKGRKERKRRLSWQEHKLLREEVQCFFYAREKGFEDQEKNTQKEKQRPYITRTEISDEKKPADFNTKEEGFKDLGEKEKERKLS